jgi:tetrahydromethanopterin S-methyltransferase subunit E
MREILTRLVLILAYIFVATAVMIGLVWIITLQLPQPVQLEAFRWGTAIGGVMIFLSTGLRPVKRLLGLENHV